MVFVHGQVDGTGDSQSLVMVRTGSDQQQRLATNFGCWQVTVHLHMGYQHVRYSRGATFHTSSPGCGPSASIAAADYSAT